MNIKLIPIDDTNREAVIALSVRDDQPFVAPNDYSLRQADEANAEAPGVARPFAIYADERLVGFCMFAFSEDEEEPEDRYWLWRFMIDKNEQGKGYGQAALSEIIRYFRENGADRLYLSTEPENERGIHVYRKAGFRYTGFMDDEAVYMQLFDHEIMPLDEGDDDLLEQKVHDWCYSEITPEEGTPKTESIIFKAEDDGKVIAGCIVNIHEWGRAVLSCLWVDEKYRKQGLGSMLIKRAEQAAKDKGCYYMCLGTLDFQAKPLYEKHGYTVFGTVTDYPKGHENYSLMKRLDKTCTDYVPTNNSAAAQFKIIFGTKEDAEVIRAGLNAHCDMYAPDSRDDVNIGRKLVNKDGKMIAGISAWCCGWNECDIDSIWVDEKYRGVDLGSVLLGEVEREAKEKGAYIALTVATDLNVGFFKEHDYVITGTLPNYPKGHTAYELEKRL